MTRLFLIVFLLVPLFVQAEEGLVLKDTTYFFDSDDASCRMQMQRKKEREKKLREYYYALGMDPLDNKLKASEIFISMFTDFNLMNTPRVTVTHLWEVDDRFIKVYKESSDHLFLELTSNGIWWRERKSRFPDRIEFSLNEESKELITTHRIFYSDFCSGDIHTTLVWDTVADLNNPTVEELLEFLFKD